MVVSGMLQIEQQGLSVVILQAGAVKVDCGAVARQRGIGLAAGRAARGQLCCCKRSSRRWFAAGGAAVVKLRLAAGGAAKVDWVTAGRAVEGLS